MRRKTSGGKGGKRGLRFKVLLLCRVYVRVSASGIDFQVTSKKVRLRRKEKESQDPDCLHQRVDCA